MSYKTIRLTACCIFFMVLLSAGCNGTSTTSEDMTLYQSTEHGFSIEYPEEWSENVQEAGTQFSFEFTDFDGLLSASVYLQYECQELVSSDYIAQSKTYLSSVPGYELISERTVSISNGISGREIVAKGDIGTGEVEKFRFVFLVRGQQGFSYGVHGEPAEFDDQEEIVEAIMDSFKLLSTFTFAPPEPWPGGTYTGSGFSITIPEGWCQYPVLRSEHVCHFAPVEKSPSVHISVQTCPEDATLQDYVDSVVESIPTSGYWANFNLTSKRSVTVGGTSAYELVFTGMSDLSPGYTIKCKYLIIFHGEQAFWVMASTYPEAFQQHEAIIDDVIYSFRPR
ncbi:MAG TPA: hypothetical protein G4O10_10510 [Dehalococcoidia bacterium]|nr:hypothetical protein [Dehalococcoidia bacterium]